VVQRHEDMSWNKASIAYAAVVGLLLMFSLVSPACTEEHGVGASTLRTAGLCASVTVAATGVAAVVEGNSEDAVTWPVALYPAVVFVCFHLLSRISAWRQFVGSRADCELQSVLSTIREDPSELQLTHLAIMLEAKKPLGLSGFMTLASELSIGQWRLPALDLALHGMGAPESSALMKAISTQCCELQTLNLRGNKLGNVGAAAVAEALPNCAMTLLDLSYNNITYDGIVVITGALRDQKTQLCNLKLSGNIIDTASARAITEALESNVKLVDLSLMQCGIDAAAASALFEGMCKNTALGALRVGGNQFGSGNLAEDPSFALLAKLLTCHPTLQILHLDNTKMGRAASVGLADVISRSNLVELVVQGNNINDQGMDALCRAMKKGTNLVNLSMSNCNLGRQSGIHLAKMLQRDKQALTSLDLSNNSLCNFGMFYDGIAALSDAILSHTSLRNLNLERNQLRNMGCWSLAKMIGDSRCRLECLNLASNEIRARGATAIFNAVALSQCVTHLSMRNNIIDSDCVSALQGLLLTNRVLQSLDLENNDLCERSGKLIAAALVGNETLSMISLIMNEFRIKEAELWFSPEVRHLVLLRRKDRATFDNFQRTPLAIAQPRMEDLQMKSEQLTKTKCIGCNCLFNMMKD